METFESIEKKGLLLYKFIKGSHSQGTDIETSDIDEGGIFLSPTNNLLDLGYKYQDQIADERNDKVWYELKKYFHLLLKSNPTMLETLFIDDEFILYEHPLFKEFRAHKDMFLTKQCFKPMFSFSTSQIEKMRGLNKKIVNPITERLGPLDFAYTFYKQGSTKIKNWLEYRALNQKYCGLVNIPNMEGVYGVYYDWANHFRNEDITYEDLVRAYKSTRETDTVDIIHKLKNDKTLTEEERKEYEYKLHIVQLGNMARFIEKFYLGGDGGFHDKPLHWNSLFKIWLRDLKPIGYKGMVGEDKLSNELRLSSVSKGEKPICYMSYNKNGYSSHCVDYKNYMDWVKHRNPVRYASNLGMNYDSKNCAHCLRIMQNCIEIARGEGFKVNRRNIDRDFLIDVRNHKYEYDEIKEIVKKKKEEMDEAIANSTLPDEIDVNFVNDFVLKIRKEFFK